MSYQECINQVTLYKNSFNDADGWIGNSAILNQIKVNYDRCSATDKENVKKFITQCILKPENVKQIQKFFNGAVIGTIALPVIDAMTNGTPSFIRGAALAAMGFFGGAEAGYKFADPGVASKKDDIPYINIERKLELKIAESPDFDEQVEAASLRHRRVARA